LVRWRRAALTDRQLVIQLEDVRSADNSWRPAYLLGLVHLERGDRKAAVQLLEEACAAGPDDPSMETALEEARALSDREVRSFEGHTSGVSAVAFSPEGRQITSGSYDTTLRLWEVADGRCLHTFKGHAGRLTSVAYSPDGSQILSGSGDKTL